MGKGRAFCLQHALGKITKSMKSLIKIIGA